jgi:anaphase-promoting complex subunit 8
LEHACTTPQNGLPDHSTNHSFPFSAFFLHYSEAQKHAAARNPYLQQLSNELLDAYESSTLDAFGLHVYGMVLAASKKYVLPTRSPTAQTVLMQSLRQFPYNWSAWLDLAACALDDRNVERDIEEELQPALAGHFMYHFFCAHLQAEHQAHPEALQIYERWMDASLFGGSPYLLTQYAVVQYHLRQFAVAKRLLEDLHHHMPFRLDSMDVYSNILYVQEDSVALSQLAHTAVQVDKYRAETCCIVGNYYSLKQLRAKAIQYFKRALKMDRSFTSAWTLMGHEYVEWKQTANAMEAYRRAVQVAPTDYRAWYGLGQVYEFLNMHLYALYYYKQATQLRPYDARMWCAMGLTYTTLLRTEDAIKAYERALQQDDTEGVATQKLASLYRAERQDEKAAQCYFRHLELRYQVTHPNQASTGPVNLETLLHGLVVETAEAEALLFLANYHKDHWELGTAKLLCSKLLEYPGPEKEEAKALLRDIRSRTTSGGNQRRPHTRSQGTPAPEEMGSASFEFSP